MTEVVAAVLRDGMMAFPAIVTTCCCNINHKQTAAQNMQANLFSAAIDFKEEALKQLSRFELREAHENLAKARDFDPYLADLDLLLSLCEFAQDAGAHAHMTGAKAEQLWQLADEERRAGKIAIAANKFLRELIARRLLEGQFTPAGFCPRGEEYLHRGVCHLVLGHWQAAHQDLLSLVTDHPERTQPMHWAYFADSAQMLRRWPEANLGYALALLAEPQAVDDLTLAHPELRRILQHLQLKGTRESLARAVWPFEAWREQVLQIPRGRTFLFAHLQRLRSLLGSTLMLEREQRLRQFCLCLYIDQANLHDQINFNARAEMQALEPELFAVYLGEISRRSRR